MVNILGLRLWLQCLKIPRLQLWLRVKFGRRLLNLCDCDSVLSERCRQKNFTKCHNGLVYYALFIISLYSVTLWKHVRPTRSPLFWQDSDSDSGILNKLGLPLWPCAKIHTPGTLTQHPWGTGALKVENLALKIAVFGICSGTPPLLLSFFFLPLPLSLCYPLFVSFLFLLFPNLLLT